MPSVKRRAKRTNRRSDNAAATIRELRKRVRELEEERSYHVKAIWAMLPPSAKTPITAEEIRELKEHAVPFEEVIRRLEALKKASNGKSKRPSVQGKLFGKAPTAN